MIKPGSIIYAYKPAYRHYGIYISENEVIHFNKEGFHKSCVVSTSLSEFAKGLPIEECYQTKCLYSPLEIAKRAISKVGCQCKGDQLINNDCEYFINWCANDNIYHRQTLINNPRSSTSDKLSNKALKVVCHSIEKTCDVIDVLDDAADLFLNRFI